MNLQPHELFNISEQFYNKISQIYGENNLLGVFPVGPANYGFARDESEYTAIAIYLPTFEELCIGIHSFEDIRLSSGAVAHILDIREIYNITNRAEMTTLEILYSNGCILNLYYDELFKKYFIDTKEKLAHYNPRLRINKAATRAMEALEQGNKFEALRLYYGAVYYHEGYDVGACFHLSNETEITNLQKLYDNPDAAIPEADNLPTKFISLLARADDITDNEVPAIVRAGIVAIMGASLNSNVQKTSELKLTSTEKKALDVIKTYLTNGVGNISISTLVEQTNISRPVFKNLLLKLKDSGVAEITNQGVKGTYLKLLK